MTIDEAIKTDETLIEFPEKNLWDFELEAIKLGIEALKREKERRHYYINSAPELLPGETMSNPEQES